MTLSNLPTEYKDLALKRQQDPKCNVYDCPVDEDIEAMFLWSNTPEGVYWWDQVEEAETIDDLPPLPESFPKEESRDPSPEA